MNRFLPSKDLDLYFRKTVTRWDEAIPLGTGLTGVLIWGNGEPLRLSLDRGDLWDNRPASEVLAPDYTYEELVKLVKARDQKEILRRFDHFYVKPTPTKIPAGRLEMFFGQAADNVKSHLSLARAEADITLFFGDETVTVSSFMHADDKYGFLRVKGAKPEIKVFSHDFTPDETLHPGDDDYFGSIHLLGYPAVELKQIGRVQIALQKTAEELSFALMMASCEKDGCTEVVYHVAASTDGANWLENAAKMLEDALDLGYDEAIKSHLVWWEGFWGKSRVSLTDKVIEKNWYLTNYFLGSCSRKNCPPMPLQGVWTADDGKLPPWKGDYHGDLNTQFSYYNYLKADHLEEGESFLDFMWNLNDKARAFAKSFFDADGLCLPSVFGIDGTSLGGWPMYSTNITNQVWEAHLFYMYYRYTGDEGFMRDRLYPYLKGAEGVVRRHLQPDENGKLVLPLSASPEIHDNTIDAWLDPISNFDISLLHFLYDALIELAPAVCPEDLAKWQEIRPQLPELSIDPVRGFMLNAKENLMESHRHFSHVMAICPMEQYRYTRSPEEKKIIDDSIRHLEELGMSAWCGFSFTWMAELYARAFNGEGAAFQLKAFFEYICSQNGFDLNHDFRNTGLLAGHGRPFTLETNMYAADAVQEMLMQCYDGTIRVFPAIPADWKEMGCEFEGFLSFGGVKVSSEIKDEKVSFVRLNPKKDTVASIYNPFCTDTVKVSSSEGEYTVTAAPGEAFNLTMKQGVEYTLTV